jgi:hypothetical protein
MASEKHIDIASRANKLCFETITTAQNQIIYIQGGPKVRDLPFHFIRESGRRDSIVATNRYWPELLVCQKRILRNKCQDVAEVIYV